KPLRGFQILGLFKKTKGASPSSITNRAKITANLAQFSCLRSIQWWDQASRSCSGDVDGQAN
ncbi:MAG: hypothetical protein ACLQVY_15640, partial [Limisphaerales bacterium]